MRADLPYPIAFAHHLVETARSPAARYDYLLQCYEAAVRYCATVQLSDYLAAGCPDPGLNRKLLDRLKARFLLGNWVEVTREITALQKRDLEAFIPEMADFLFQPGEGTAFTPEGEIFNTTLSSLRNEWAHRKENWSEDTFERKLAEHQAPFLERLLRALDFLGRYNLYVPARGPRPERVQEAYLLMGPWHPPRYERNLELELAPAVRRHLEYETIPFLVDQDEPARQLLLYPLSVFANRDGVEDIFLFTGCDLHRQAVRKLLYRAVRLEQKPLEVRPGSPRNRVVEDFGRLLRSLGLAPAAPAEESDPATDFSADYFTAQEQIVEDYTRHFVGRADVRQALDEFLRSERRGYFLVCGGPGQGKTAVACQLVRERRLVHHFIAREGDRAEGRADPRLILRSLLAQLLPLAGETSPMPESVPELSRRLEEVLARLAWRHRPLVLVLDGLDDLPAGAGDDLPFLLADTLPDGVYVVVTARPGDRLQGLRDRLFAVPERVHDLGPLALQDIGKLLRARRPDLTDPEVERIADISQGNPLYLRTLADELGGNPGFDLRNLPRGVEAFFRRSVGGLGRDLPPGLRDVLGLLGAARKPLSLRELSEITGARQRQVHDEAIRPVRQFLLEIDDGYAFYHARFHEFVTRELLYEDELPDYHRQLAAWLQRPESRAYDYRWGALAYHLFEAEDRTGLMAAVDQAFLAEKARRFGYAVLEDLELLTRAMLEAGHPGLVRRCADLVEALRPILGGGVVAAARQAVRGYRPGPAAFRSRVVAPPVPSIPGLDVYVGMLPKIEVGADFVEVISLRDRLVAAIGDAPGVGLKSAFTARFVGNYFRRLVGQANPLHLGEVLGELDRALGADEYFEPLSMQCVEVNPAAKVLTLVNAGHPYPLLFSSRRGKADRLPVRGDLLNLRLAEQGAAARYDPRRAEIGPGDVLILVSDGLTEGPRLTGDRYGYRFERLVEQRAREGARAIGEAILDDWRQHPRESDDVDDVTVLVVAVGP